MLGCLQCQTTIGGTTVRVGGIAKGSGMIHPNMATMLAVVTTDAKVDPTLWRSVIKGATDNSFNQVRLKSPTVRVKKIGAPVPILADAASP